MRSGIVAVIGKANAGKSTLINVMVGEKVAIVSPKPQTTRDRILGVVTEENYQIVFADTPGIYKSGNALSDLMMKTTELSSKECDLLLYVHDGHKGVGDDDIKLMKRFISSGIPMMIAYTKIDIMEKDAIPEDIKKMYEEGVTCDVFPVSARKGSNIRKLKEEIACHLPEGEKIFVQDIVSDKSERFMIGEIMREKILLFYDKEIPHGVAIIINKFELGENGVYNIDLDIICEKPNHKAIIIGKQGAALKKTASFAREDMEKFLERKVYLTTYVKVKEDWRDRESLIKQYGYDLPDDESI